MPIAPLNGEHEDLISLESALLSCDARLGPGHPETISLAHRLAIAYWRAGRVDQALGTLDQALGTLDQDLDAHPGILDTLAQILLDQGQWDQAARVLRDLSDLCVKRFGALHPASLSAKGDLAEVLFDLGEESDARAIETEAYENARVHLGHTHPVCCVMVWNRVMRCERAGDYESARKLVSNHLTWLLAASEDRLDADQKAIRDLLARRFSWDTVTSC